jgi:hypothetical protein
MLMLDEMRECSTFIPLFGRQSLSRFNLTLAELFSLKSNNTPLPFPGSEPGQFSHCESEYQQLREWLVDHGTISADGQWNGIIPE